MELWAGRMIPGQCEWLHSASNKTPACCILSYFQLNTVLNTLWKHWLLHACFFFNLCLLHWNNTDSTSQAYGKSDTKQAIQVHKALKE